MTGEILHYDGSFEGLLTVVFYIYEQKLHPLEINRGDFAQDFFTDFKVVETDDLKAQRVVEGIQKKGGEKSMHFIYRCFLSEQKGIELKLLHFIKYVLNGEAFRITDYTDPVIVDLHKVIKMIRREVHRMHAFVRFQETKDGIWACNINPDFNVLPLIGKHFKDRYPAQNWLIFDMKRKYGIYYEVQKDVEYVQFPELEKHTQLITEEVLSNQELDYQAMWRQYFKSVNIEERNNPKLHLRHVPKRYWRYLIEK